MLHANLKVLRVQVTFYHQRRRDAHHRHLVLGHAAVVAGVVRGEVGDDQEAGHLVDADSVGGLQGDPVPEPGDEHRGVALGHEASLAESLALFKIVPEDKVLNFWCN